MRSPHLGDRCSIGPFSLLLVAVSSPTVFGLDFTFRQSGFSEGAVVTGAFSGTDLVDDGQLSSFEGEITRFSMRFSGNSRVPGFAFELDDLQAHTFDIDGGPLFGDGVLARREGVVAADGVFAYFINLSTVGQTRGYVEAKSGGLDWSDVATVVTRVPEPAALLLFAFCLLSGDAGSRATRVPPQR